MALDEAKVRYIEPDQFDPVNHYYNRVLNAHISPLVRHFMNMSLERIVRRYCHLNPHVKADALMTILTTPSQHLMWAGCDLMHVTNAFGHRKMVVIETNSSPSGQKSMPLLDEENEYNGYRTVVEQVVDRLSKRSKVGELAVIYDKNPMEASGYAATMADLLREKVWLIPFEEGKQQAIFDDGMLSFTHEGKNIPLRFAYRYVTQRPWNRIPVRSKTQLLNPIMGCLAGGRNKALAAKAYDWYNAQLKPMGLWINTPKTIWDVHFSEVPLWVQKMGGYAVIKVPYSNAGQGVYTITNPEELQNFMNQEHRYDRYIVQSLIGHYNWSSGVNDQEKLFHVGTIPNKKGETYVADLRMMVCSTPQGWRPVAMYARRAAQPITEIVPSNSWEVLGTNLSGKTDDGKWITDSGRLLLMDERDFNRLGLSLDEMIEAFVQTILATLAIDQLGNTLLNSKKLLKHKLFAAMCNDDALMSEIMK